MDNGADLLRDWIARAAQRFPDKPWIIPADGGPGLTYRQLQDFTRRIATFLSARGIRQNDRIALLADNSVEHLLCYFGVMAYGATICTVHVEMNRHQLDNIFQRVKPKLILYQADLGIDDLLAEVPVPRLPLGTFDQPAADTFFGAIAALPPSDARTDAGPDDDAVILFTSGTGDRPKGVVLGFREHLTNIDPTAESFGITADDRVYDFRSFNWASAQLLGALVPVNRAATLVMAWKFSASRFFRHLRDHRVTVATGNPTTINMLLNSEPSVRLEEMPALRFVTSSSAPLPLEEWRRFETRFGIPIAQGYGSTETGWIAAMPGEGRRFGTVGRPFAYHSLAVVDEHSRDLPCGQSGQIEIGGFAGHVYRYLGEDGGVKPHARERIRTGDIGHLDPDGFLTLTGRDKELIIRGGVNISPVEIDGLLLRHPELMEAATIGVPDAVYGEEIVAYVVPRPGSRVDDAAVLRFCGSELPAFKTPKRIVLCASLPKTERGKLDRKALRERWLQQGQPQGTG